MAKGSLINWVRDQIYAVEDLLNVRPDLLRMGEALWREILAESYTSRTWLAPQFGSYASGDWFNMTFDGIQVERMYDAPGSIPPWELHIHADRRVFRCDPHGPPRICTGGEKLRTIYDVLCYA